jgi:hypothetical protein
VVGRETKAAAKGIGKIRISRDLVRGDPSRAAMEEDLPPSARQEHPPNDLVVVISC